jgi:hypothetical protein
VRLATVAWNGSSSAALVVGDRVAPVRNLQGRTRGQPVEEQIADEGVVDGERGDVLPEDAWSG